MNTAGTSTWLTSESVRARLAPSPTGFLHMGNAWAFLLAWLACRHAGGCMVLRMEDLDPARSKMDFVTNILDDLLWLGLDWDEGPDKPTVANISYLQSERTQYYITALQHLGQRVYPCYCTRKELREQLQSVAGAPHIGDMGVPYAGTCRTLNTAERIAKERMGRHACLRFDTTDFEDVCFDDRVFGRQCFSLAECGGDFALRRSDGVFAYQLAVTVDDGLMGINQVIRGADLLVSTPRQLVLFDNLGFTRPYYAHIPLLCDNEGERLAKRHQSLTLRHLRVNGVRAESLVGFLAHLAGLVVDSTPRTARELVPFFSFSRLPKTPLTLNDEIGILRQLLQR